MSYSEKVLSSLKARYPYQPEFLQAAEEILTTLQPCLDTNPKYEQLKILERMTEPERTISFRVEWVDDKGEVQQRYRTLQGRHPFTPYCK